MSKIERIMTFNSWVKKGEFPNLSALQDYFEISRATAFRDVEFLRDRLMAPIVFDADKNGYYYEDKGFGLPFENNQQLLVFAAILNKVAEKIGLSEMGEMQSIREAVSNRLFKNSKNVLNDISCEFVEIEPVDADILEEVFTALESGTNYFMRYADPSGKVTEREIRILRLHAYQGKWYILSFCFLRGELRLFHSGRIAELRPLETQKEIPENIDVEGFLNSSYGIFKGGSLEKAEILFTGVAANIIKEQIWHRDQIISEVDEGIVMVLPVTDYQEIKSSVLKYGHQAMVVGPPELREDVAKEIQAMHRMYSSALVEGA